MTMARKCDLCGELFAPAKGCVTLDVRVVTQPRPDGARSAGWSEVDFCPKCSSRVLDVIGYALIGLRRPRR